MLLAFSKWDELPQSLCLLQEVIICSLSLILFLWASKVSHLCLAGSTGVCQQQGHLHQLEAAGQEEGEQRDILAPYEAWFLFFCSSDAEYLHYLCANLKVKGVHHFSVFLRIFINRKNLQLH